MIKLILPGFKKRVPLAVTLCLASLVLRSHAASNSWDGGGADAYWSNADNWSGDINVPGSGDTATFNAAIANGWGLAGSPIVIDSATQEIGSISFGTSSVGNYTIGATDGNSLFLTSDGKIQILDTATNNPTETIGAPLVIVGENASYSFNNGRNQITSKLILNGDISAGSIGDAVLKFDSKQSGAANEMNGVISDGAADRLHLSHNTGKWTYSGNNTYTGDTTINAGSAIFTGNNSGGGNFAINSGASAYFTGTNSYAGSFTLTSGSGSANVYLGSSSSDTGSILGVTDISINGGRIYVDNTAGNADRLNDSVAIRLYGNNAIFQVSGNGALDTTETVGAITLGQGTANIVLTNPSGRITTLNAESLTRDAGHGTAILNTRTLGLGSSTTGRFFLATGPSGGDLVGTGGSPSDIDTGVKNLAIVPWLYGTDNGVGRFITYDSMNGLRYLAGNETQATIGGADTPAAGESGDNVRLVSDETGITTQTINSLMLAPSSVQVVTGAGVGNDLTISSGALAHINAQAAVLSGFDSVTFGNGESVITVGHVNGSLQIDSAVQVTSAGALTKTGAGLLILSGDNAYSGVTTLNQGNIQIGIGGTTGDFGTSAHIVLNAGTALNYNRTDDLTIGSVSGGGSITVDQASGSLTLVQTGAGNVIDSISGAADSTLVLAGTGETTIGSKLGTHDMLIKVDSGTVNLASSRQTAANLEITGGVVNTTDAQFSMRRTTLGTQTLTISGGELNVFNSFGLKGLNNDGFNNGVATDFIATQTGGSFSIAGTGSDDFVLGNETNGASTTYNLSGGLLRYVGTSNIILMAKGTSTTTFNLSGGTLQSARTISGRNSTAGTKQAFVWTGGVLATLGYDATKLTSGEASGVSSTTNTLTNGGGTLAPGDIGVTGRTTITGNYEVTSDDAVLHIDIAGTSTAVSFQHAPGTERYDIVTFGGSNRTVTLGGKLVVNLLDGFDGSGTFTIINNTGSGGAITGAFNNTVADASGSGERVVLENGLSSYLVNFNATNVSLGSFVAENTWAGASGANWSEGANWSAFVPSLAGHVAKFADAPSEGAVAVNLDADETVAGIQFESTTRDYTISSGNASGLTFDNNGAPSSISVVGTHHLTVPVALNDDLTVTTTGAGDSLNIGGEISGVGKALTKEGVGTLILTGTNSYTGDTTVNQGALIVSGSISGSTTTVASGATLGGNGGITGDVNVSAGGTLAPGDGIGTLNTGNVAFAANSTLALEIKTADSTADLLHTTGGLTLASNPFLTIDDIEFGAPTGILMLLTYNGTWDGGLFNFDGGLLADDSNVLIAGNNFTFDYNYDNFGEISVALIAVPEPGSLVSLLGGLGLLTGLRRFRRRR